MNRLRQLLPPCGLIALALAALLGAYYARAQYTGSRPTITNLHRAQWTTNPPGITNLLPRSWTTNRPSRAEIVRWSPGPSYHYIQLYFFAIGTNNYYAAFNVVWMTWTNPISQYPGGGFELQVAKITNANWLSVGVKPLYGDFTHPLNFWLTNSPWVLETDPTLYRARLRYVRGGFYSAWSRTLTNLGGGP